MSVDLQMRLNEAETATDEGRYPQALAGFMFFHEHAANDPGQAGVRLSFALSSWLRLAHRHPPAGQAMRELREAAEAAVLDEASSNEKRWSAFMDVVALNRQLNLDDRTVAVYRRLSVEAPAVADRCAAAAFDTVADSGDPALAWRCLGADPDRFVLRKARALAAGLDATEEPIVRAFLELYVRAVTRCAAVLRSTGHGTDVPRIQDLAVQAAPDQLRDQVRAALHPPRPS